MEISKEEANLIMGALDRVDVRGLETNRQVMILAARLQSFLQGPPTQQQTQTTIIEESEDNGDDVPDSSE